MWSLSSPLLLLLVATCHCVSHVKESLFELSVVHVNDFHARFDEITSSSGNCKEASNCIGGFSRLYTEIKSILKDKPKSILLNAGDNFQGTLYYTLGKWNITQEFLNTLPFDATVLGNHEFDDNIDGLVPFMKALKSPLVTSNIDDSLEPSFQGLYNKSIVIERDGKKIGIIGVIYSQTDQISGGTGNLKFLPESENVNAEAERLVKEEGVFTNIVLSHCGYDVEKAIAANASEKIGLVVGAHSHTFLFTGDNPPGPDTPAGPYPTIIKSRNNKEVLVVQASAYSKYLGNITVFYSSDGEVADYSGSPIFLDTDKPKDDDINTELAPWKNIVEAQGSTVLGSTNTKLGNSGCYYKECTLGNFVTDAMIFKFTENTKSGTWTRASIAVINAGGLRTAIEIGDVTYGDLLTAQPFANTIDMGKLQGKYIKELFEQAAQDYNSQRTSSELNLIQVSGVHVAYDLSRSKGDRVTKIKVRCQECQVPKYEDLNLDESYNIIVASFLRQGGDGFTALSENIKNVTIGDVDVDVFSNFLATKSPVYEEEEGRIEVISDHEVSFKQAD